MNATLEFPTSAPQKSSVENRSYPLSKGTSQADSVRLRYDDTTARYASQFLVSANEEEILLDCSSGVIIDPSNNQQLLPIHSRLALSNASARRLLSMLSQALNRVDAASAADATQGAAGLAALEAKPPRVDRWTRMHGVPTVPEKA